MLALSPSAFTSLFAGCVLGPLVLLACLLFKQRANRRWLLASWISFLPTVLLGALIVFGGGKIDPPLGGAGMVFIGVGFLVAIVSCLLSLVCGAFCFRKYPWSVVWLVPAAVMLIVVVRPFLHGIL